MCISDLKKKQLPGMNMLYALCVLLCMFGGMYLLSHFILINVLQVYYEIFFVCFINIYLMCISDLNRNKLPGINIIS